MRISSLPQPSSADQLWLRKQAHSAVAPRRLVERCHIVLRAAEGQTNEQIAQALGITRQKAARWRQRFAEGGRAGLEHDAPERGRKAAYGPEMQALIVERTHSWEIGLCSGRCRRNDAHLVFGAVLAACFFVDMLRVFGEEPR